MGTGFFPGVESGQGVTLTPHPLLVPRFIKQSSAITLISLMAFVALKRAKPISVHCEGADCRFLLLLLLLLFLFLLRL
jgi:hypothetical protein